MDSFKKIKKQTLRALKDCRGGLGVTFLVIIKLKLNNIIVLIYAYINKIYTYFQKPYLVKQSFLHKPLSLLPPHKIVLS